jgi:metal-responsive CopG/Arc/MetJ family transcriptional regulator
MSSATRKAVTVSLPADLTRQLDLVCKAEGSSRSEVVRDALQRQLAIREFRRLRRRIVPKARARGIVTDEDAFRAVS